ncbi:hypothetical protein MHU86_25106 [Fragilaria crotonensis]|nr:hypothetical protein MHU86_25106 [Fragilaria crotonensis]
MNDRDASYTLADREEETEWEEGQTRDLRRKYMELLDKYPLTTKSCTSALLGALGAIIAGMSIERSSGRRLRRVEGVRWLDVLAYAICGALQGPLGHYWYAWWEENGPESQSNSMLVDRILVQPPMILLLYVSLDVIKAALKEIVPSFQRSMAVLGPVVRSGNQETKELSCRAQTLELTLGCIFVNNDVPSLHNDTKNLGWLEIEYQRSDVRIWRAAENLTCFMRSFGVSIRQTLDH